MIVGFLVLSLILLFRFFFKMMQRFTILGGILIGGIYLVHLIRSNWEMFIFKFSALIIGLIILLYYRYKLDRQLSIRHIMKWFLSSALIYLFSEYKVIIVLLQIIAIVLYNLSAIKRTLRGLFKAKDNLDSIPKTKTTTVTSRVDAPSLLLYNNKKQLCTEYQLNANMAESVSPVSNSQCTRINQCIQTPKYFNTLVVQLKSSKSFVET